MKNINLNELRDRAYKTACEHGFHDKELSNEHLLCALIIPSLWKLWKQIEREDQERNVNHVLKMDYNRYPALVEEEKRLSVL